MPKMTFVCEFPHLFKKDHNLAKITYESNRDQLDEIIEDFEDFLRGAGFSINGKLDIVNNEDFDLSTNLDLNIDVSNMNDTITLDNGDVLTLSTIDNVLHSDYYYDINRNR